ncbi:MAG: M48 family metallopeptidase [Methylobacter sp.]
MPLFNLPFSYQIRRSQRATRTRIVVTQDKVEVVAPAKVSEHRIHQFVLSKQQWIVLTLAKIAANKHDYKSLAPDFYGHGAEIPYQGEMYKLVIRPSKLKRIKIEFSNEFIAYIPEAWITKENSDELKEALIKWMKKNSRLQVERLVNRHAEKRQLFPRTINMKTQRSRWGSCGIYNDIHINWLLIMAPPEVLEYVVVHELCHIQVKNHSTYFWALVGEHMPGYQQQRHWLRKHGHRLMMGL